ncbi:MAG: ACT domain-containing protein [Fusobacteriaceae bacterium]|nr:ACT domain-containing protein [Fusobacteriaceae bacterium]MBN2838403.1 ACT domain-containing protein [Fusobacteriaceae bacterium]
MKGRVIVTVLGSDKSGIVASVSKKLCELKGNIIDITQTIFDKELFAMIMLVDLADSTLEFDEFKKEFKSIENELNLKIYVQHEDIFKAMHRI